MAHLLNVIIAIFLSAQSTSEGDSCVWYLINIFIDSTIGTLICCLFIYILNSLAETYNWKNMKSGLYFEYYVKDGKLKNRLKLSMYIYQLISWLVIVIFSKFILAFLQLNIKSWLVVIGSALLYPVRNNPKIKLVIVMICFPVIMNSIQFWVTDNFLKLKKEVYPQLELPKNNQLQYESPQQINEDNKEIELQIDFDNIAQDKNEQEHKGNNSSNVIKGN